MAKKVYVLDTSVFLSDSNAIFSYENNDIVIPLIVLEEIDNHKKRSDSVGTNARAIIRILDSLREKGSLADGVKLRKGHGLVHCKNFRLDVVLPSCYSLDKPDNQIIATALSQMMIFPEKKIILVSCDINMRIKCDALGINCENYISGHVVKNSSELYSGFQSILVDDQIVDRFYKGDQLTITQITDFSQKQFFPNQFLMLISNSNEKKTALARFIDVNSPLKKIKETEKVWDVIPKNKEQAFAIDLLKDFNIPIVSLVGIPGGGKTMLAIAAGLEQVIGNKIGKGKGSYSRLIVARPVIPMGKDIGYLPGTKDEKLLNWLGPVQDNLRSLMGNDQIMLQSYVDQGVIELEALTYIRGRSIENSFIIIDESQNLSPHEIKTILTRVGNNSKIVLTGDITQIDNVNVDEISNGLTYAIEKLKTFPIFGHITLTKGERSIVATTCASVL